jgi:AmiR/NasT family two-component response regulator
VRRVLIGDFGVVARMGLRKLLDDEGLDVLEAAGIRPGTIPSLSEVQPDVVLLDLDAEEPVHRSRQGLMRSPASTRTCWG